MNNEDVAVILLLAGLAAVMLLIPALIVHDGGDDHDGADDGWADHLRDLKTDPVVDFAPPGSDEPFRTATGRAHVPPAPPRHHAGRHRPDRDRIVDPDGVPTYLRSMPAWQAAGYPLPTGWEVRA